MNPLYNLQIMNVQINIKSFGCELPRATTDLIIQRVSISIDTQLDELTPEYGLDHVLKVHWIE